MGDTWKRLLDLVVPVEEKIESKSDYGLEKSGSLIKQKSGKTLEVGYDSELNLNNVQFLNDVRVRPFEYTQSRYEGSILAHNTAVNAKKRLCRLGYLEEVPLKTRGRGKPPSMLRLTEKAVSYLGIPPVKGKGSLEHQWWQHLILHLAKKNGMKAKIEDMGADLFLSNGLEHIAVEITLHESNIQQNTERDFRNGFSQVWIAVKDEAMSKKVNNILFEIVLMNDMIKVFLLNEIILKIKEFSSSK